jgi:hypothetical protein
MNEHRFLRLFRRIVLLSTPLPVAAMGYACGGATIASETETTSGAGGSGTPGSGGDSTGAAGSGTGSGGSIGTAGSESGTGGGTTGVGGGLVGSGGTLGGGGDGGSGGIMVFPDAGICVGVVTPVTCGAWKETVPRSCVPSSLEQPGTALPPDACRSLCYIGPQALLPTCSVSAVDAESVTLDCRMLCFMGRRPAGLAESAPSASTSRLGDYFAQVAHLEAASVDAFKLLARELASHRAPRKLRRAAARAARDEVRHARMTSALARRFGGKSAPVVVEKSGERSLEAIAIENAVEGCVRETYGALLATWQAHAASDPRIRAAMIRIASDETRHAALSWSVAAWLNRQLSQEERTRVEQARHAAVEQLLSEAQGEDDPALIRMAGLPSQEQAVMLAHRLARSLPWAAVPCHLDSSGALRNSAAT